MSRGLIFQEERQRGSSQIGKKVELRDNDNGSNNIWIIG